MAFLSIRQHNDIYYTTNLAAIKSTISVIPSDFLLDSHVCSLIVAWLKLLKSALKVMHIIMK